MKKEKIIITKLDQLRLNKGQQAEMLPEPKAKEEMRRQLNQLDEAVTAMQSLDDLGSPEANRRAMEKHDRLMERYLRLKREYDGLESSPATRLDFSVPSRIPVTPCPGASIATDEMCTLYHSCNSQCRDGVHAVLVYSDFDDTTIGLPGDVIRFDFGSQGLECVDYYRAREPISKNLQGYNHLTVYDVRPSPVAEHPYVVFVRVIDESRVKFLPEV